MSAEILYARAFAAATALPLGLAPGAPRRIGIVLLLLALAILKLNPLLVIVFIPGFDLVGSHPLHLEAKHSPRGLVAAAASYGPVLLVRLCAPPEELDEQRHRSDQRKDHCRDAHIHEIGFPLLGRGRDVLQGARVGAT